MFVELVVDPGFIRELSRHRESMPFGSKFDLFMNLFISFYLQTLEKHVILKKDFRYFTLIFNDFP